MIDLKEDLMFLIVNFEFYGLCEELIGWEIKIDFRIDLMRFLQKKKTDDFSPVYRVEMYLFFMVYILGLKSC